MYRDGHPVWSGVGSDLMQQHSFDLRIGQDLGQRAEHRMLTTFSAGSTMMTHLDATNGKMI